MAEKTPLPTELEWETPQPQKRKQQGSVWDPVAAALKARPREWACIGRDIPTGIVTTINRGQLVCFRPKGSFEAVTRNHSERWRADVYARYLGEPQE